MYKLTIKKKYVITSLLIFFFHAAPGTIIPIFNLIFREKGVSLEQIGFLLLMPRIFSIFSSPLWAGIADAFQLHKRLLPLVMALTIPLAGAIYFAQGFVSILIWFSIYSFFFAPLIPLTDNAVLDVMGEHSNDYGKIRVFGAISWGLAAWLAGVVADMYGINLTLWLYVIFISIAMVISLLMPESPQIEVVPFWKSLRIVTKDTRWIGLLSGAIFGGYGQILMINYIALYLRDLGASVSFIGLTTTVSTISEVPIFLLAPRLLERFDKKKVIQVALLGLLLRCALLAVIKVPYPAIFIQMLSSLSYALFWITNVAYVREIVPVGFNASGQALIHGMYMGVGGMLGTLAGGFIYEAIGPSMLFFSGALAAGIGILLVGLLLNSKPAPSGETAH